jgi:hypothetical protein
MWLWIKDQAKENLPSSIYDMMFGEQTSPAPQSQLDNEHITARQRRLFGWESAFSKKLVLDAEKDSLELKRRLDQSAAIQRTVRMANADKLLNSVKDFKASIINAPKVINNDNRVSTAVTNQNNMAINPYQRETIFSGRMSR